MQAYKDSVKNHLEKNKNSDLSIFTGKYLNEVYGFLTIDGSSGKELKMSFQHHPGLSGSLLPISQNTFLCTFNNPIYGVKPLPFEIENGKVKKLMFSVADFVEFTQYEFIKEN